MLNIMTAEKLFTVAQVAKIFQVSERTVWRWIENEGIRVVRIGRGKRPIVRIPASEIRRLGVNVTDDQGAGDE